MTGNKENNVCPVERASTLDNRIRRWLHNPRKILGPFVKEGMTVLDLGCGPGVFSVVMAQMVGISGRVIAADMQEGMLEKLKDKIQGTELEGRITLHKCEDNRIGVLQNVDFILLFYMVHEVPNKKDFFDEIAAILRPKGQVLMVEPPVHVSRRAFADTVKQAMDAGLTEAKGPHVRFSKTVILKRG
ncbi:class I SAM-dependent methyltransferase [Verrucomicrobiota bacterium]